MRRTAHPEAIRHRERALELVGALPSGAERDRQELVLRVELGPALLSVRGTGDPEVERTWARARELCGEATDAPELIAAVRGLVVHDSVTGALERAARFGGQLIALAERTDRTHPRILAHSALAQVYFFLGRFHEALDHAGKGASLHDPIQHGPLAHLTGYDEGCVCRSYAAWCQWALGRPDRALEGSTSAVQLARKLEHPLSLAHTLTYAAVLHQFRREREKALLLAEEGTELSAELGFSIYHGIGVAVRAWAGASDANEALPGIQQGLIELAGTGVRVGAPYFLGLLAATQADARSWEDALGAAEAALASQQGALQPYWDAELHRLKGESFLSLSPGDAEQGEREFQAALDIARGQDAHALELRAATSLARLWRDHGKRAEARELLAPIYAWFTEGFDTLDLLEAKALLEELGA
jgi:adenylate cyclase